ncbi:hypothetical protein EDB81DRAFT_755784 [Dactylonectria macrodidyma]|uniref:Uncharacterized protein n=1 Tax=Dactylonectria macrodidyma TaxID=307937 RepID=A0A9P9FHT1_9HYPO|nr:hypothetical protein EDB81DRAFT_755784 [Dactylonectria macrodidyma]
MERRWISVGWPADGGLWVAEFDQPMWGARQEEIIVPDEASRVMLARSMQEKCDILKSIGAKFYAKLDEYDEPSCLKAWKTKTTGEVDPLEETQYHKKESTPRSSPILDF